jgi:phospholipid/cholesterol/gamma-HCH transport system permease protein
MAVFGGYLIGVQWLGVDSGAFWSNMSSSVDFRIDVLNGVIKSLVFGFVVTWIAVYQGFATKPTPEGIGRATTYTVVYASLLVLALDFVLTAMMMGGW